MKTIVVPTTIEAMEKLDFDACTPDDLVELRLSENEYNELWQSGVLDTLNQQLGLLIDDYEDESIIEEDKLLEAKNIVKNSVLKTKNVQVISKLLNQIELALRNNTGVFFYF